VIENEKNKYFEYSGATDKGKIREKNEDALACFETINGTIFVICDGMGGHKSGDVAANIAIQCVREFFSTHFYENPYLALHDAIFFANQKVYSEAQKHTQYFGMGTTIAIVLFRSKKIYYAHAGDSRIYLFSHNQLKTLTKDDSYVQRLVDKKVISEKDAAEHPRRHEITKAIGIFFDIQPSICNVSIKPTTNEVILLCTDGLNSMLTNEEIEYIVYQDLTLSKKVEQLIDRANDEGGYDNITVQLIKFTNLHPAPPTTQSEIIIEEKESFFKKIFKKIFVSQ